MLRIIIPIMLIISIAQIMHRAKYKKTDIERTMPAKDTLLKDFFALRKQGAKLFASLDEFEECFLPKNIIFRLLKKSYFILSQLPRNVKGFCDFF
ncbi:MAG: hypothetical protein IJE44_01880 [Clostridia bacterium]|nr:hypothetical protein [Clostridia bacterium]